MSRVRVTAACPAALLLGCHSTFTSAAPKGFVELDQTERYDFRATTADGLVIAARQVDHDPEASLDFWARAVENAMRTRGGYALLGSRDLKAAGGLRVKQLRFGHDEANRPHLYYVTLLVTHGAIYVLEAGGDKAQLEQHAAEIDAWISHFRAERCAPFPFAFACAGTSASAQN